MPLMSLCLRHKKSWCVPKTDYYRELVYKLTVKSNFEFELALPENES